MQRPEVEADPAIAASVASSPFQKRGKSPSGDDLPLAPMGERRGRSAFEGRPGYVPPNDPEAHSIVTGRREAPRVDREFAGGASSAEELAQQILDALRDGDPKTLDGLRIDRDEFADVLWPEFPASRPITRLKADDAWFFLDADCIKGKNLAIYEYGGMDLQFDRVVFDVGKAPYRNFTLFDGARILTHRADGTQVALAFAPTFAERDGTWKVYCYKD